MSIITNIFRRKKDSFEHREKMPSEYLSLLEFNKNIDILLTADSFIARSDYAQLVPEYAELDRFFHALQTSRMLDDYIRKNGLDASQVNDFLRVYDEIKNLAVESPTIKAHNDKFVELSLKDNKKYLDTILKKCDPNISLDNEQREVVVSDEDYTLVVAGAGAGKTTTVAAKVKYLVEKRGVAPESILVISFTNKAVNELKDRINKSLGIPCPITTFHSAGYAILRKKEDERRKIVDMGFMYKVINDYLKAKVLKNPDTVRKLILFFGSYFNAPFEGDDLNDFFLYVSKADFATLKSNTGEYIQEVIDSKTKKVQTLRDEIVRSLEEVRIANFLYLHNIDYEYEPFYQYHILDANKPYTPDFRIWQGDKSLYIEHFGISESGNNNLYSEEELAKYKKRINDKITLHRKHKTDLAYTFSRYNDGRDMLIHLKEQLIAKGFDLVKRPDEQVYKMIVESAESKYITRLTMLLCNFIQNFKTQGYDQSKFDKFASETKNVRTKLFLDICRLCYLEYQQALEEEHSIDFEDMINECARIIHDKQVAKEKLLFKYIIVDEYQDISRQRYNLINELSKLCSAKIVAVGDDWQSIYAFSGSILPSFTRFCQEFGYGQELKITRTYRNAQELIDIAGNFIQKNSTQIKKQLISPKRIENPVIINTYSEEKSKDQKEEGGVYHNMALAVNQAIDDIIQSGISKKPSILLLGRYGFDARNLAKSDEFIYDDKKKVIKSKTYGTNVSLDYMTAHSSKGLSADNVIIINAKDELFGFPSKIADDPVLKLVVNNDDSYDYAEERRLFYVALTRTKNRVYIITPQNRPSVFIKELLSNQKDYPNVALRGDITSDLRPVDHVKNRCPKCGYPLQKRYHKNHGLRLWICTNDQEMCGYMTNDLKGGSLSIQKCDWCKDGYLVVKKGQRGYFLGCTNYNKSGNGCGRMVNLNDCLESDSDQFGKEY